MTININSTNKPVMPVQAPPVLKAVDHPSEDQNTEHTNVRLIETLKANNESQASNVIKAKEEKKEPEQALDNAVKQLNSYAQSINRNLEFNIDTDSGETVVKVIDADTEKIIRQIPNEEALLITKRLDDKLMNEFGDSGLLLPKLQA